MFTINTIRLNGVEAVPVTCECEVTNGTGVHVVGLVDSEVKDKLEQSIAALQKKGFVLPGKKIIINLAPGNLHVETSGAGLAVTLALAAACDKGEGLREKLDKWLVLGDVNPDGELCFVPGCVQGVDYAINSDREFKGVIIPETNAPEVAELFANSIKVYPAGDIGQVIDIIEERAFPTTAWERFLDEPVEPRHEISVWDSFVAPGVKRALEIAVAGGHNIILVGNDEDSKRRAAKAALEIMPRMSLGEEVEVAKAFSAATIGRERALARHIHRRPFQEVHHDATLAQVFGTPYCGGNLPGEFALANKGVLYMRNPELASESINEAMDVVLSLKSYMLSRYSSQVSFSVNCMVAASVNACLCGKTGTCECECTHQEKAAYRRRTTGTSAYAHSDIQTWVNDIMLTDETQREQLRAAGEDVEAVAACVEHARQAQIERQGRLNGEMSSRETYERFTLDKICQELCDALVQRLSLRASSVASIIRVARTIADLAGHDDIRREDLCEASSYRFMDRM